jgi:hypothetical protein
MQRQVFIRSNSSNRGGPFEGAKLGSMESQAAEMYRLQQVKLALCGLQSRPFVRLRSRT